MWRCLVLFGALPAEKPISFFAWNKSRKLCGCILPTAHLGKSSHLKVVRGIPGINTGSHKYD